MGRLFFISIIFLSACSSNSHKPAPGWPDGPERPINAKPPISKEKSEALHEK